MRRSLAILALAATAWSPFAALHCDLSKTPTHASAQVAGHHGMSETSEETHHPSDSGHHHGDSGGDECQMVLACGGVTTEPMREASLTRMPLSSKPAVRFSPLGLSAQTPPQDPPPPRRLA